MNARTYRYRTDPAFRARVLANNAAWERRNRRARNRWKRAYRQTMTKGQKAAEREERRRWYVRHRTAILAKAKKTYAVSKTTLN